MKWKRLKIPGVPTYINELGQIKETINVKSGQIVRNRIIPLTKVDSNLWGFTRVVDGEQYKYAIHRLLADAFLSNPHKYHVVKFKDGKKDHYALNNLEWAHARNCGHKLTFKDIKLIHTGLNMGIPVAIIAKNFNVSESLIRKIRNGERWG